MLIHLVPRLYDARSTGGQPFELVDFQCAELGIRLTAGTDITARRPYRNKRYAVVCRRTGRRAINGLFIETAQPIRAFTAVTRWVCNAQALLSHRVRYEVLDEAFGAVTEDMSLWYAMCDTLGGWCSRWPDGEQRAPLEVQPRLCVDEETAWYGTDQTQSMKMPTVERERLLFRIAHDPHGGPFSRLPALDSAFRVDA